MHFLPVAAALASVVTVSLADLSPLKWTTPTKEGPKYDKTPSIEVLQIQANDMINWPNILVSSNHTKAQIADWLRERWAGKLTPKDEEHIVNLAGGLRMPFHYLFATDRTLMHLVCPDAEMKHGVITMAGLASCAVDKVVDHAKEVKPMLFDVLQWAEKLRGEPLQVSRWWWHDWTFQGLVNLYLQGFGEQSPENENRADRDAVLITAAPLVTRAPDAAAATPAATTGPVVTATTFVTVTVPLEVADKTEKQDHVSQLSSDESALSDSDDADSEEVEHEHPKKKSKHHKKPKSKKHGSKKAKHHESNNKMTKHQDFDEANDEESNEPKERRSEETQQVVPLRYGKAARLYQQAGNA